MVAGGKCVAPVHARLHSLCGRCDNVNVVALADRCFYVDVTAKVKLCTADEEKGLGTGEMDYALPGEWYKNFEHVGLFGAIGYEVYGDPPGTELDNAVFASIGADYGFRTGTRAGL